MWGGAPAPGAYGAPPQQVQQVQQVPSVQAVLDEMYANGSLLVGELDFNVQTSLRGLSEPQSYEVVSKFREANTGGIRNKSAFLSNVIKRIRDTIPAGAMGMGAMPGVMPGLAGMNNKTVHIGNLPTGATPDVVRQLFSHFGAIVDVRFGGNAKYAFVDYVEPASATAALGMNQYDLWGFRLRVEAASSFRQTGAAGAAPAGPLAAAFGCGAYAGAAGGYQQPIDYGAAAYGAQPAPAYGAPPGPPPGPPTDGAAAYGAYGGQYDQAVGQKRPRVGEPGGPEPQTVAEVDEALTTLAAQQAELEAKIAALHEKKAQLAESEAATAEAARAAAEAAPAAEAGAPEAAADSEGAAPAPPEPEQQPEPSAEPAQQDEDAPPGTA